MNVRKFSFKGDRSYILGADLYETCLLKFLQKYFLEDVKEVRVSFPRSASRAVQVFWDEDKNINEEDIVVVFKAKLRSSASSVILIGRQCGEPVHLREKYPESEVELSYDEPMKSVLVGRSPLYGMHGIAAATKFLHMQLFPPRDSSEKWFLTRFVLKRIIGQEPVVGLRIQHEFVWEDTRTSAQIFFNGENIGEVYCQLRKK